MARILSPNIAADEMGNGAEPSRIVRNPKQSQRNNKHGGGGKDNSNNREISVKNVYEGSARIPELWSWWKTILVSNISREVRKG